MYFPESDWAALGVKRTPDTPEETLLAGSVFVEIKPGKVAEVREELPIRPWTKEEILGHARHDLAFAFEKALGKRGISAELMTGVVEMWAWILETPLPSREHYPQYGLPILKAAALAWGFENPIGDDTGSEYKYSSGADA